MTVLHELLVALLGHPGDVFEKKRGYKAAVDFPYIHPSERLALDQVSSLGLQYEIMQEYVEDNRFNGIYRSALGLAIDRVLNSYHRDIVELGAQIESENSVLGQVALKLSPYILVFDSMVRIIEDVNAKELKGVMIMNYIEIKRKETSVPSLASILQTISDNLVSVFFRQVCDWIFFGTIGPFEDEFMIISIEPVDRNCRAW